MNKKKSFNPFILVIKDQINSSNDSKWISEEDYVNDLSPMSGSEPAYEPLKWNLNDNIRETHNCYSYAINKWATTREDKSQPGYRSEFPSIRETDYNCMTFYERMRHDIPGFYLTNFKSKCHRGFYKGFLALAIDHENDATDYHFYRQDNTGYWSHKPGRTDTINLDSDGKKIKNPLLANRAYPHFNYSIPCFFFCVNTKMSSLHSIRQSKN